MKNISLTLRPGQPTALLGSTGAGKSTLINLMLGFLRPAYGSIQIDDYDLIALDLSLWRQKIAWIPQNPYAFNDTLGNNLLQARPDAAQPDLIEALAFAGLDEVLEQWPQGLETHLGSEGALLSAGQVARLALARAYLRDAPVVLLDEPTAHLDPSSEESLIGRLGPWLRYRTAVIATHRMSLALLCSQVVVLKQGEIVQAGSQTALAQTPGPYQALLQTYQGGL